LPPHGLRWAALRRAARLHVLCIELGGAAALRPQDELALQRSSFHADSLPCGAICGMICLYDDDARMVFFF
jgi:hypothetical protein